jgi:hypothetical protein
MCAGRSTASCTSNSNRRGLHASGTGCLNLRSPFFVSRVAALAMTRGRFLAADIPHAAWTLYIGSVSEAAGSPIRACTKQGVLS